MLQEKQQYGFVQIAIFIDFLQNVITVILSSVT